MRIGKGANAAVGKYFETFVREAIARAAFERAEAVGSAGGRGDGFLEVSGLFTGFRDGLEEGMWLILMTVVGAG